MDIAAISTLAERAERLVIASEEVLDAPTVVSPKSIRLLELSEMIEVHDWAAQLRVRLARGCAADRLVEDDEVEGVESR